MLDWLKTILGEAYSAEIDKKVSDEIGKNFVARSDFNTLNTEKKALADTVKERDAQLETLKKSSGDVEALKNQITQLQTDNSNQKNEHEAEMKKLKIGNAVDMALTGAKAKNNTAVKALMADFLSKAELADDGTVKGLGDEIKKLVENEETAFLFDKKAPDKKFKGAKPSEKGDMLPDGEDLSKMTYDELWSIIIHWIDVVHKVEDHGGVILKECKNGLTAILKSLYPNTVRIRSI